MTPWRRALRQVAKNEGVAVRGTIWPVGALSRATIVNHKLARATYAAMLNDGRQLPVDEMKRQLDLT